MKNSHIAKSAMYGAPAPGIKSNSIKNILTSGKSPEIYLKHLELWVFSMATLLPRKHGFAGLLLLAVSLNAHLLAQQSQAKKLVTKPNHRTTLDEIKTQLDLLQSQISQIQQALMARPTALPNGVSQGVVQAKELSDRITLPYVPENALGSLEAPFVLVEFSDPQCPFCRDFALRTLPLFQASHIANGRVRLLSAEFPLPSHPEAEKLSLASVCAGQQGKYWDMQHSLMSTQSLTSEEAIQKAEQAIGISTTEFNKCLTSSQAKTAMQEKIQLAKAAGVSSTPTFLLGRVIGNSVRGIPFVGDLPFVDFSDRVDTAMRTLSEEQRNDPQRTPAPQAHATSCFRIVLLRSICSIFRGANDIAAYIQITSS